MDSRALFKSRLKGGLGAILLRVFAALARHRVFRFGQNMTRRKESLGSVITRGVLVKKTWDRLWTLCAAPPAPSASQQPSYAADFVPVRSTGAASHPSPTSSQEKGRTQVHCAGNLDEETTALTGLARCVFWKRPYRFCCSACSGRRRETPRAHPASRNGGQRRGQRSFSYQPTAIPTMKRLGRLLLWRWKSHSR